MKWVLVLILLKGVTPETEQGGVFNSMIDCFDAREKFMDIHQGIRPAQAVCIRTFKA